MDDETLSTRLASLENHVAVSDGPPTPRPRGLRAARAVPLAVVGLLVLAGGAVATGQLGNVRAYPGAFDRGQPLHCSGVAAMTPAQADPWLRDHGYVVTWQIEDRSVPKGGDASHQSSEPPATGLISAAVITDTAKHQLIVVAEVGAGATGTNDCQ
jgi:hypothetical protein